MGKIRVSTTYRLDDRSANGHQQLRDNLESALGKLKHDVKDVRVGSDATGAVHVTIETHVKIQLARAVSIVRASFNRLGISRLTLTAEHVD